MTTCPPSLKRLLSSSKSGLCLIATGLTLVLGSGDLCAATHTWTGEGVSGGNPNWTNPANWQDNDAIEAGANTLVFPGGTSTTNVNDWENLRIEGITFASTASPFTLSGARIISSSTEILNQSSSVQTFNLDVGFRSTTGNINTGVDGGGFIFNGKLDARGLNGVLLTDYTTLTLKGSGAVEVTNATNERLHWVVQGGTLKASPGALGEGKVDLQRTTASGGATLILNGSLTHTISNLSVGNLSTISGSAAMTVLGVFGGNAQDDTTKLVSFTNAAGITLNDVYLNPSKKKGGMNIDTAGSQVKVVVEGVVSNSETNESDEKLTKSGEGVLLLRGASTYSGGTTISGGTLLVENTSGSGLGSGAAEVRAGARLGGSGIIKLGEGKTLSVKAGGTIAPGAEGLAFATLRLSGADNTTTPLLDMEAGSTFTIRLGVENASDGIVFSSYRNSGLTLDAGGIAVNGIDAQAGSFTLFTFDNITEGELTLLKDRLMLGTGFENYHADFVAHVQGAGGSIGLAVIPEPGITFLGLIGFATATGMVRKRRRNARPNKSV